MQGKHRTIEPNAHLSLFPLENNNNSNNKIVWEQDYTSEQKVVFGQSHLSLSTLCWYIKLCLHSIKPVGQLSSAMAFTYYNY